MNGSEEISFVPVGRTTFASLSSKWKSPSFDGAFLPSERSVGKDGFNVFKMLGLPADRIFFNHSELLRYPTENPFG